MAKFLIVEDSQVILKIMRHIARQELDGEALFASSMAEALALYEAHKDALVAGVIDLSLPDAPDGELVDALLTHKFPVVVLTGSADAKKRERLMKKGVADYVIKDNRFSYQYAIRMLSRLNKNQGIQVLVVDDSMTARKAVSELLRLHLYKVHEADGPLQALDILRKNTDISLMITDYNMPDMTGSDLILQVRREFEGRVLSVIGLSAQGSDGLSVRFIKNGADDFLQKPFVQEEFFCRVTNNVESLERLQMLREQAIRDYLTGLYNRRYFVEQGEALLKRVIANNQPVCVAVIDIDHFRAINDEYGHDGGDIALVRFSRFLANCFGKFLIARTGGEEFCVLMPGLDANRAFMIIDEFRAQVSNEIIDINDDAYERITVSAGLAQADSDSLRVLLKRADEALFAAKEGGRNLVVEARGLDEEAEGN